MSWHGFKKAVNRATTSMMQSTGAMERTVDKDFDEEERRFKVLKGKVEKLQKESKGYLDAVRAMTLISARIATTIDQFYDDNAMLAAAALRYKEALEKLDESARTELDQTYRTCVLEPLGRFNAFFPDIEEGIKRRNKKLLDYDAARAKVRKLVERPSEDSSKLPFAEQEANQAREIYETLNRQFVTELPKLVDLRVPFLDPCFDSLLQSQYRFCDETFFKLNDIRGSFEKSASQNLDGEVERVLYDMRQLAICGNV